MRAAILTFIRDPEEREHQLINFIFALLMCNAFMGIMKLLFWLGIIVP